MAAELVAFQAADDAKEAVIEILEGALERARRGEVRDVAVVLAVRDEDGPQHVSTYYGQEAYAVIVAGVAALSFDLHYQRYKEAEGR